MVGLRGFVMNNSGIDRGVLATGAAILQPCKMASTTPTPAFLHQFFLPLSRIIKK
jgi:hypothetical protein